MMLAALVALIVISAATWWLQWCYDHVNKSADKRDGAE